VIVDSFKFLPRTFRPLYEDLGAAHPHINDEDLPADPEIALPGI